MKKNLFLIAILSVLLFACGHKESTDTAIDYDAQMMEIQNNVDAVMVDLFEEISNGQENVILDAQDKASLAITDAKMAVDEIGDFDGKDDYKKTMIELLQMYESILDNEFSEIIDYTIYFDELTDEEWEYTIELENSALDQYEKAFEKLDKFREDFAEEWNFELKK